MLDEIYHDDCMDFMSRMEDKSVKLTLTDIPYNECNKESAGLREIDKGTADYLTFDLETFLSEVQRVTKGSIYIFCGIQQVSTIYGKFREDDMVTRHCVWHKTNPSPMNGQFTWLSAIENCIFAKFSGATFNASCQPNVWKYSSGETAITPWHPTQKPVPLFKHLIEVSSNEGETVFDPCIGSGTTAAACISSHRHFIGVEKNEEWYDKCQKRIKREMDDIDYIGWKNAENT